MLSKGGHIITVTHIYKCSVTSVQVVLNIFFQFLSSHLHFYCTLV